MPAPLPATYADLHARLLHLRGCRSTGPLPRTLADIHADSLARTTRSIGLQNIAR